jgi:nickel-dependent lactate racemase
MERALSEGNTLARLLDAAADAGETVLLPVNDGHRATQTRAALVALAGFLGTQEKVPRCRAIVATGTHRFGADERAAFERDTFGACGLPIQEVAWHDTTDEPALADLAGVRVHRWLAEARYVLPIGSVEPHYFAGVTGAHKTLTVGCMSREAIERNHAHAMSPAAGPLRLQGNPVFDDIVDVVRAFESGGKIICAVNQVVRGEVLVASSIGSLWDTLEALMPTVRQLYVRPVPRTVDVLRLRVPLPLGRNLYQADKALKNNHLAVRDGGGIVLEADCAEGVGPDAFLSLLRRTENWAEARRIVDEEGYHLGDHKAVRLRHLTDPAGRGIRVALVSPHISRDQAALAGMRVFAELPKAVGWLAGLVPGPFQHGLVVEDAGVVCTTAQKA